MHRFVIPKRIIPKRIIPTLFVATLVLAAQPPASAAAIVADSASDVCAAEADPCVVSEDVRLVSGAVLDFGLRTLHVTGEGRLDVGAGRAEVRCGNLIADVGQNHAAIVVRGNDFGEVFGGSVEIKARNGCEEGTRGCMTDEDCDLGACSARRCSLRPSVTCGQDEDCQIGSCIPPGQPNARRCTGRLTVRCLTNADCDMGTCPADTSCEVFDLEAVSCGSAADCHFGQCTIERGTVDLDGAIQGEAAGGGFVRIEAAGDVTLRRISYLSSTSSFDGGGELDIRSHHGNVSVLAPVDASGHSGGFVTIEAGVDVRVDARIKVNGGVGGAGDAFILADRDVIVTDDILANGVVNGGPGGSVYIDALRDIRVEGGSAPDRVVLSADGADLVNPEEGDFGGAGDVELYAGRDIVLTTYGRATVNGGSPHGPAGGIWLVASRDARIDGTASANSTGAGGTAGSIVVDAAETLTVGSTAALETLGLSKAESGSIEVVCGGEAVVDGKLTIDGSETFPYGAISVSACDLELGPNAYLYDKSDFGRNVVTAGSALRILDGARMKSVNGINVVRTRSDGPAPSIDGEVEPAPTLTIDDTIEACAPCNDPDEAEPVDCDDGVECTVDLCTLEGCASTPEHSLCADTTFCDGAEICDPQEGCVAGAPVDCSHLDTACAAGSCSEQADACVTVPVADGTACDDGDACTTGDACAGGVCEGGAEVACAACGNETVEDGEECDDGDEDFAPGDACTSDCRLVPCGFPLGADRQKPGAPDALFVLRAAVSLATCAMSVCNVDGNGALTAGDSLYLLAFAVGRDLELKCTL